jgi:hypothetical protein
MPLCDLAVQPGFSGPGLCLDAASLLIDPATGVDLGYDLVDGLPELFLGGVPEIGARESGSSRQFGSTNSTCP